MMNKILIVEDDSRFRALLKRLLEKKFHLIVYEAENGIKGLDLYKREAPKVIFLDISMPLMNGIEFLEKLRAFDKEVPVIIMTCLSEKEYVQKMLELGISDYLLKTDFVIHLSDRIGEILRKTECLV